MKKLMGRTARLLSAGAFFIFLLAPSGVSAHATAEAATAHTEMATAISSDAYGFTAKEGYSLTKIARRALQLYQTDKKITLTPAAAVYGETTIVQALGSGQLEVGQHVDIPSALLQSAVDGSKTLTSSQLKKWEQYAMRVSFDVDYIEAEKPTQAAATDESGSEQAAEAEEEQANAEENATEDKKTPGAYWWFIGAGALVAIYFVLGGPTPRRR